MSDSLNYPRPFCSRPPAAASVTSLFHLGSDPPFLLAIDNGHLVTMTTRGGEVLTYQSADVAGEMLADMECDCEECQ